MIEMEADDILEQTKQHFEQLYDKNESHFLSRLVLEEVFHLSVNDIFLNKRFTPSSVQLQQYIDLLKRSKTYEPIQYILGYAHFYDRKFRVNQHTLIPRQETEMLIELVRDYRPWSAPKMLDIGTGSGCIACSLALEISDAELLAVDISEAALECARSNVDSLEAKVSLRQMDILTQELEASHFDAIVSNPPYVMEKEKEKMQANVLNYEPPTALFVANSDPLLFYTNIASKASKSLKKGGALFFEINEQMGKDVNELLIQLGFSDVNIHKDLNGKDRFSSALWL